MNQKTIFIVSIAGLLLAFIVGMLYYSVQKTNQAAVLAEANRSTLIRMHSPTLGRIDAPVVIVEFIDPACETCRAFYPLVKQMMADHPDKIRLVLRYTPFHEGSGQVVAVLEAARKQNKFWPALEALLASQAEWTRHHTAHVSLVWPHLEGLGLNMEQMRIDMASPEIANLIAQDLDDARTLNVTKTPEFFVNGKPLPKFGHGPLKALVDEALASSSR